MEAAVLFFSWLLLGVISLAIYSFLSSLWERGSFSFPSTTARRLPPGPIPLPLVGNLFLLGSLPHRSLARLAKVHGPLMTLKLGFNTTIVISSSELAKEALQKYDHVFSGRQVPDAVRILRHDESSVVWRPPDKQWRELRKIHNTNLFSPQKLDSSRDLRREKVAKLVEFIGQSCKIDQAVDIGRVAFVTVLNLLSNTVFSTDVVDIDSKSSQVFKELVWSIVEVAGRPNISDFFPMLALIDPQGNRRRQMKQFQELHKIFDEMIISRRKAQASGEENRDVLDALLNYKSQETNSKLDLCTIKAAFMDIFVAGSETSSTTVEWTMAELLRNPSAMAKARSELAACIPPGKVVDESDIPRLPYLQAVVKEALRLHPPVPLLIPHRAEMSVVFCGYTVPKHSQVLVNAWAIGRDPHIWVDPDSFLPDRFLDKDVDYRGRNFELIPFGAGRRICPGLPLAFQMVHLILASLLHSFEWRLLDGMVESDMDMREKVGLTMSMVSPLKAIPIQR